MSGSYRSINNLTLTPGTANNMTGTTAITSLVMDIRYMPRACLVAAWTGTASGTISVQGSVDNITFSDMGLGIGNVAGVAGNSFIDLTQTAADYVRLVYTNTGGTGTLTVKGSAKS